MKIIDSISTFVDKATWTLKKDKPEILLGVGIVLTIGAVVTACRATVKATRAIDEFNEQMDIVEKCAKDGKTATGEEYTEEDRKKDTTTIKVQNGLKIAKFFLLPVGLTGGAIVCQIAEYRELSKRIALISAAYAVMSDKFKKCREYIRENFGESVEYDVFHGIKAVSDGQDLCNKVEFSKGHEVYVADDDDYSVVFDERSEFWEPDFIQNLSFLQAEQAKWNMTLKTFHPGKPVFLNQVRKRLGLPETELGQVVGWVYAPDDPDHNGDNFINFGIDRLIEAMRNGEEIPIDNAILLDFNVDGNVLYAVNKKKKVS